MNFRSSTVASEVDSVTREAPEVEVTQEVTQEDTQEDVQEMTEEGCTDEENDPKGKKATAAAFIGKWEMTLVYFLRDNKLLYNKCFMDYKDPDEQEAL